MSCRQRRASSNLEVSSHEYFMFRIIAISMFNRCRLYLLAIVTRDTRHRCIILYLRHMYKIYSLIWSFNFS